MAEQTARDKRDGERKEKLIEVAKKRWQIAESAESEQRALALEDIRFAEGEQWDAVMRDMRRRQGRPCLTINRIPQFVQHITNEQRQNPISIKIDPVDSGADVENSDVLEGLVRHIENQSNADEAYSNGFDYAVKGGWGYWRVATDYANELSFDQEIYIKRIENPFDVLLDPNSLESDGSDAGYGFIRGWLSRERYEEEYPGKEFSTSNSWFGDGYKPDGEGIFVVEYFYREMVTAEIVRTSDEQVYLSKNLPKDADGNPLLPAGIRIVERRQTAVPFVKWALLNDGEVLDEKLWAGKYIPIIKVVGQMTNIDGQRVYKGIVRDARDPQQMFNLWETAAAEAISTTPKAPYLATAKQIQGYEKQWGSMNVQNRPYLLYNSDPAVQGAPQRNQIEPPIQAMMLAVRQASDDLKATAGIYDAALGAGANDVSGKAILARQEQSNISAFHFGDNLKRSIRQTGRVIIDLIPFVYNTPKRIIRIIGEDGSQQTVQVNNQSLQDGEGNLPAGIAGVYNLTTGKYDVTISSGPSYQTKRQEAVETQIDLLKVLPQAAPLIADKLVANMDIPQAREIAERLKTLLPAPIQAMEQQQANIPPEFAQQFAQMQAQMQQLQAAAQQAATDLKYDLSKKQMEIDSQERIQASKNELERERIQASIITAELNAKASAAEADAQREMDWLQQQIEQAHEVAMGAMQHEQAQEMQQNAPEPQE